MQIERLTERLLPQVEELERLCFSLPWSHETLVNVLRNPACCYFAATEGEALLGYAGMQSVLDEGYVDNVAVSPAYRRQGLAFALLTRLIETARERQLAFLTLEVRAGNAPAIALYEKLGFKSVGRRRNYYEKPREDALLMTLFF